MSLGACSTWRLSATVSPASTCRLTSSGDSPYSVAPGISATARTRAARSPTGRITSNCSCGMRLP